jgi:hypothetical protein
MESYGTHVIALLGACFFALGCGAAPVGDTEEDVTSDQEAFVYPNGDGPRFFWQISTQSYLKRLAAAALINPSTGQLANTALLSTAQGKLLLHYVIGCSVPQGVTVTNVSAGFSDAGAMGLAPDWRTGPLSDETQQRWVTACLLQTLNGLGMHVPIRLVGSNPGLADQPWIDASEYYIPDATMFGNIFAQVPTAYACVNSTILSACGSSWSSYSSMRICDSAATCGISLLGDCGRYCTYDAAGAPSCTSPAGASYAEAIATTLDATGFQSMYRSCILP